MSASDRRRALVIGGANGMGRAGVESLVASGWQVAVADLVAPDGIDGVHDVLTADLGNDRSIFAAVHAATESLGGLDAVWNHAGLLRVGTIETLALADLDRCYAINVRANVVLARAVIPILRESGGGSLLFTASAAGVNLGRGVLPYTVTKTALLALMRQLALEHAADGIRVNALCPGWVDTAFNEPAWEQFGGRDGFLQKLPELVPLGRMASLAEIGDLVAALLSPAGAFITGQSIVVDGGEGLEKGRTQ
jgi:NAD(P)-dependent dehydrogenase (short-subunit alcohol dehydrogenase family)